MASCIVQSLNHIVDNFFPNGQGDEIEALTMCTQGVGYEDLLYTFHNKICTHKTQLGVELLCSCILTSKVVQGNVMKFINNLLCCVHLED
jgi:hypothetical protein